MSFITGAIRRDTELKTELRHTYRTMFTDRVRQHRQENAQEFFELSVGQKYKPNMLGSVYASGNKIDVDEGDSDYKNAQLVNQNNWQDDLHTGVYVATNVYSVADKTNMKIETPDEQYQEYDNNYPITLDAAEDVYNEVLSDAGATLPKA